MGSFFSRNTEERRTEVADDQFSGSDVEEFIANAQAAIEQAELDYIPPTPLNGGYWWNDANQIMDVVEEVQEPIVESSTPISDENIHPIIEISSDSVESLFDINFAAPEAPDRTVSDIILDRTLSSVELERTLSSEPQSEDLIIANEPIAMI